MTERAARRIIFGEIAVRGMTTTSSSMPEWRSMTEKMVNRVNVKLLFIVAGLSLSVIGVYLNSMVLVDFESKRIKRLAGEELPAFFILMGVVLSFAGVVIPIASEKAPVLMSSPQPTRRQERADEKARLKQVELLCPKCGAPATAEMIFCANCGARITPETRYA